jgi:putative tryptophan/tyrosine transport system substrate-binding protein
MFDSKRREFIALVAGMAAGPSLVARAEPATMPVVGFLDAGSAPERTQRVGAFRKGLAELGYQDGQNVRIEFRWAESQYGRFPELAADLVRHGVSVIAVPGSGTAALAAKAATATIPIVFSVGIDPVKTGLVASFTRPAGNATGIHYFALELTAKRLGLLRALAPEATRVAILVNPANGPSADETLRSVGDAARSIGLQTRVLNAGTSGEIDAAFATLAHEREEGVHANDILFVSADGLFQSRSEQLVALTARDKIPAAYPDRAAVVAGGLMSYGADITETYRQVGVYTGNILKGAKPADLPVRQSTKFEFVINRKTAKALGLEIPVMLVVSAELID